MAVPIATVPAVNPNAVQPGTELTAAQQSIACFNCNTVGHLARQCPHPPKEGLCFKCHQPGHRARDCPQALAEQQQQYQAFLSLMQPVAPAATATCFKCGQPGHLARQCRIGQPPPPPPPMMMMVPPYVGVFPPYMPTLLSSNSQPPQCYLCNQLGHIARNCPTQPRGTRGAPVCFKCQKPGHVARDCTEEGPVVPAAVAAGETAPPTEESNAADTQPAN